MQTLTLLRHPSKPSAIIHRAFECTRVYLHYIMLVLDFQNPYLLTRKKRIV